MRWFTSDLHLYHGNILKYCPMRPYATVEEMNEMLVLNWNALVKPDDIIYCLGDFSMTIKPVETFTSRLNGYKILIHGNHDWTHPYHKKSRGEGKQERLIAEYKSYGWSEIHEQLIIELEGIGIVRLCHLPYSGPKDHHVDDKYAKYRPSDDGTILLNGHVHQSWKMERSPLGTLMLNVGVDVHDMKPISELEVIELIKNEGYK